MRIFLDGCGTHVSVQRMIPEWENMGVGVDEKPDGCDVQLSLVRRRKETGLPLVLRIDGIYYNTDIDYAVKNVSISEAHASAAAVIYQSEFCRGMCERYLAPRKEEAKTHVIYNGITPHWCGPHKGDDNFNIVVSAIWRRHKRLREIEKVFWRFTNMRPNTRLHVFGDLLENKPDTHPHIYYYGQCTEAQMSRVFQMADVSIHLSKKDCSPYTVVEAIAAGVPVLTTSACGGAAEMCEMTKGCMVVKEDDSPDPCAHYSDEYNSLSGGVINHLNAMLEYTRITRQRVIPPKQLGITEMAERYIQAMKEVL